MTSLALALNITEDPVYQSHPASAMAESRYQATVFNTTPIWRYFHSGGFDQYPTTKRRTGQSGVQPSQTIHI
jgi:hypothetical protein